jgi:hypothetical protein
MEKMYLTIELKYHQAAFDLVTQQPIDPTRYLADLLDAEDSLAQYYANMPEQQRNQLNITLPYTLPTEYRLWTTLPLLGTAPEFSPAKIRFLERFEQWFQIRLPASLREWYSLTFGLSFLYVNEGWIPKALDTFGAVDLDMGWSHQLLKENLLALMSEDQAGELCIRLDEGDDPPVYFIYINENSVDEEFDSGEIALEVIPVSPSFSDFICCFLWDWLQIYNKPYVCDFGDTVMRGLKELEAMPGFSLARIHNHFNELTQHWLGYRRFDNPSQQLLLPGSDKAGQMIGAANDEAAMRDLIRIIWDGYPARRRLIPLTPEMEILARTLNTEWDSKSHS